MSVQARWRNWTSRITLAAISIILSGAGAFDASAQNTRVFGVDISYWNCGTSATGISQANWTLGYTSGNRVFAFLRATRGGTTGLSQTSGTPAGHTSQETLSRRYDDPRFVQNIGRATTAGMLAGPYHFGRPDIAGNTGTDEADHFIEMAGAWMRPGYLLPVYDLEAGSGAAALAQFAIDFSDRIYAQMQIRPGIYIGGSYSSTAQSASASLRNLLAQPGTYSPSVVSPAFSMLWNPRYEYPNDDNNAELQTAHPKDSAATFYGPWDDYGTTHPWAFWQFSDSSSVAGFNNVDAGIDSNVAHGDIEYVRNFLVPAVWWHDSSGDWSTLANWNSGQTPTAPVTPGDQTTPYATTPIPTQRLPGASGSGTTSGQYDTVILERPSADVTVTISTGTHNVRKLYMRETLNVTGGSLTVNYDPTYRADNSSIVLHGGSLSAQFSGPVTLSGGDFIVHTLQVDTNRTFTLAGGTLRLDTINLMPHSSTPAKMLVSADMTLRTLDNALATIARGAGSGASGYVDLNGGSRTLTINNGTNEIDLSIDVPITNGGFVKAGAGTLRVTSTNTYTAGTTVSAGKLFVSNTSGSGTGTGTVTVDGGTLGGTGTISGAVTVNSGGTIAPGTDSTIGTLTLSSAPTLGGTNSFKINRNGGSPQADKLARSGGTLTFGGKLVVTNVGATLIGGEVFTNFSATAGFSGEFTATNLPSLSAGLNWYLGDLAVDGTIKVNRKPVVSGLTVTNTPAQLVQISKASLIGSATDADSDSLVVASFDSVTTNGITISSDSTYLYYSNNANVADLFNYTISDGRGGSETGALTIESNPSSPPVITDHPDNVTLIAGQSAIFNVAASGTELLSYQWKKGAVALSNVGDVSGATSASLTISDVAASDAGSYTVVVTNAFGTATSTVATLTVNYSLSVSSSGPGTVSKDPDQSSFAPGATVMLTATPDSGAAFAIWTGDAVGLDNPLTVSMTSNKSIVGNFTTVGSVTDIIIDNSDPALTFVGTWQTGTSSTDKYGTDYRFASTAVGGTSTATYTPSILTSGKYDVYIWYPEGSARATNAQWSVFYNGGSTNISVNQTNNGGQWVLITSGRPFAVGSTGYIRVSNDAIAGRVVMADAVKLVYSTVQGQAPLIISQPQSQTVIDGEDATFSVEAIGDPPSYQWRFNDEDIAGAITSSYTRENCQTGDSGTYSVIVSNATGVAISSNALLTVNPAGPPIIVTHPTNVLTRVGLDVTFAVSATGQSLAYQWRYNGAGILDATASSYTLSNAQTNQSGSYSVVVSNVVGAVTSSSAILTVDGRLPTFKITGPLLNQRLFENAGATNYSTSLKGTASDDRPGVQVHYSTNMGISFQAAIGTTNWSTPIKIVPGTNFVVVKAMDQAGNSSLSVIQKFIYVVTSTLTLATNGTGQILGIPAIVEVGRGYKITAFVGAGTNSIFTNWNRVLNGATNLYSSSGILNFMMESNLTLNANFIQNPFMDAKGTYNGLFYDSNAVTHASSGSFTLTLSPKLTYTGKVQIDGDSIPISGKFDVSGTITTNIWRTNKLKNNLALSMGIDFTNWTDRITGTVSSTNWSATLIADRQVWNVTNTAGTYTNKYTVLIPGFSNPAQAPTGSGYLLASVSALGKVTMSGGAADGYVLRQNVAISKNGEWPVYVPLYPQQRIYTLGAKQITNKLDYQGSLIGWLTFATNTPAGKTNLAPQGRLSWVKEGWTNAVYPAGFAGSFIVQSSRHVPPPLGTRVLTLTDGTVTLSNGNLTGAFANNFTLGTDNKTVLATPVANKLMVTLTKTTGALSGSFVHPQRTNPATKIFGAILQDHNLGRGYFIGTNQTGLFRLDD